MTGEQQTLADALERAVGEGDEGDDPAVSRALLLDAIDAHFDAVDDVDEQVETLNALRERLHDRSPFEEPVEHVRWVKQDAIDFNEYNPNEVATPEMELLHTSIREDGYTQPVVTYETDDGVYEVVDGEHRTIIGKEKADIRERLHDHIPVTVIDKPKQHRMSSTIRHNRARGTHQIRDMSEIVVELFDQGWDDDRIMTELGMDRDEVLRLKQASGLKKAFGDHEFSQAWVPYEEEYVDPEERVASDESGGDGAE